MPHTTVVDFIQQYGKPISITRERWKRYFPGIPNGVRVVQMKVDRPIPSYITIDGEPTLVTYSKQQKTCRYCDKPAHPKQKCANGANTSTAATNGQSPNEANGKTFGSTTAAEPATVENQCNEQDQQNKAHYEKTMEDDSASSTTDGSFIEPAPHQKRRLLKSKENEMKKVCVEQGYQGTKTRTSGSGSNFFDVLAELDRMTPTDADILMNKCDKGGNGNNIKK